MCNHKFIPVKNSLDNFCSGFESERLICKDCYEIKNDKEKVLRVKSFLFSRKMKGRKLA